jgi:hypothetical protein
MVLHRPVELAGVCGKFEFHGLQTGPHDHDTPMARVGLNDKGKPVVAG